MNDTADQDVKQILEEIRTNQQVLLVTTRKHLELYAQQLANSDALNKQLVELQQKTFQVQKLTMAFTIFAVVGVAAVIFSKFI
ncbi:MAG: hypothetical protein P8Z75_13060 [Gammaproteobacteria bacterium]|jgi:hypothetical protein